MCVDHVEGVVGVREFVDVRYFQGDVREAGCGLTGDVQGCGYGFDRGYVGDQVGEVRGDGSRAAAHVQKGLGGVQVGPEVRGRVRDRPLAVGADDDLVVTVGVHDIRLAPVLIEWENYLRFREVRCWRPGRSTRMAVAGSEGVEVCRILREAVGVEALRVGSD
ncbi:hypothetical protein GCM10029964_016740 [Kibdelosporangium lantanae]